ncbi:MAG: hypothetical protein ACK5RQ_09585 [Bacteroidota bacterium]
MKISLAGQPGPGKTINIKKIIGDKIPKAEIIKVHSFSTATIRDLKERFSQIKIIYCSPKNIKIILTILILFNFKICFSQTNEETTKKSMEIIHWINSFEDNNSPERIMQGTLQDKVHTEYYNGFLTVYSMIW